MFYNHNNIDNNNNANKIRILIYNHNINNINNMGNDHILIRLFVLKIHNNHPSWQTLTEGEFGIQSGKST